MVVNINILTNVFKLNSDFTIQTILMKYNLQCIKWRSSNDLLLSTEQIMVTIKKSSLSGFYKCFLAFLVF